MLTRSALSAIPEGQPSHLLADIQAAAELLSPRVAVLFAPARTIPRSGDHGF